MPFQVSQNLARTPYPVPKLADDIEKVIGVSNLLLIDIISNIGAFFYELYQKGTKLFKDFSKDFKFENIRYSTEIKHNIYEKLLKLDLFSDVTKKLNKDKKYVDEFEKVIGKLNLVLIEMFSYVRSFFKVLIQRLSKKGFLKAVKITAIKFSYNTKIRIYNWHKGIKTPIFKIEKEKVDLPDTEKIEIEKEDKDKKYIKLEEKDIDKLVEDEIKKRDIVSKTEKEIEKIELERKNRLFKRLLKVAVLGYITFLIYMVISNRVNREYEPPNHTMFYFKDYVPTCYEVFFENVPGWFSDDSYRTMREAPIGNCRGNWCFEYETLKHYRHLCLKNENCPKYIWDEAMKYAR